jgi:VanZ family protein
MTHFLIYWMPPLLWMAFIFPLTNDALSAESTSYTLLPIIEPIIRFFLPDASQATIEVIHILVRKVFHLLEYGFLAFLLFRAFRGGKKNRRREWILYTGAIAIGYGGLDEVLQSLTASRTGSVSDWLIDSAGVIFFLGIISFINGRKIKSSL